MKTVGQKDGTILDVPGIRVGQEQDENALTGCTVVLCEKGAVAGVDQRGGAPGTRETDLLRPMHLVTQVQAVVLAGGSAFGLDAASGVMHFLEEKHIGFDTGVARVPIVPAAVLFDLGLGRADVRPDPAMGYRACQHASNKTLVQGNAGAGCGASVGKILGMGQAMKAGIGSAALDIGGGIIVGAIVAVNAFGDVIDPESGAILAGVRSISQGPLQIGAGPRFADTQHVMRSMIGRTALGFAHPHNTVIGVVATNARLTKEGANHLALMAQAGLARVVRPAHTLMDGDTLFALSTGTKSADLNVVGAFAAEVVAQAIVNAVLAAQPAGGLPSVSSLAAATSTAKAP